MAQRRKKRQPAASRPHVRNSSWQLDWHIPVAQILTWVVTFGLQAAAILWWAATMDARVGQLEAALSVSPTGERVARIEERLGAISDSLKDVKALLQERVASNRR